MSDGTNGPVLINGIKPDDTGRYKGYLTRQSSCSLTLCSQAAGTSGGSRHDQEPTRSMESLSLGIGEVPELCSGECTPFLFPDLR
jgi:hypothetical protein